MSELGRRWHLVWDGPPPPNMNGSDSPFRRRAARRLWRANAVGLAALAGLPRCEIVRYRVEGVIRRRALLVADADGDVSRFKSVIDGLVEGRYLPGDTRRFVEWGAITEARGPAGFTLTIEELPHDEDTATRARRRYAHDDLDPLEAARSRAPRPGAVQPTPRRRARPGGPAPRRAG
jgi:hypothetical protein